MLWNIELIFQIAGLGIVLAVLHVVFRQAQKEEIGHILTLTGVVIVLMMVIRLVYQLFESVRVMFRLY